MLTSQSTVSPYSIVAVDKFIQATRDSGYKSTASAISELVDNSVQAEARVVDITIVKALDGRHPLSVTVRDDGCGMDPELLRTAMRFGGSSRFGDRSGLGRYGMGLPNASLSQAKRVDVYSWVAGGGVHKTFLDVERIAAGHSSEVPESEPAEFPGEGLPSPSGTVVHWSSCDRLDNKRVSTICRKLTSSLGRKFRYFLWEGGQIRINGAAVRPFDPLYLHEDSVLTGAHPFGEPLEYEFQVETRDGPRTGTVRVRFSELPVEEWHEKSKQEKRALGISKGAGVSVVRGGREVDYGWFLMGGKRRENYDDWWRCEICFEPVLDEAFGITHTKQQIRPSELLLAELAPDLEDLARVLNQRVRAAHQRARVAPKPTAAEVRAGERERSLPPLGEPVSSPPEKALRQLERKDPGLRRPPASSGGATEYRIVEAAQQDTTFFSVVHQEGRIVLVINPSHEFYRRVYQPLQESQEPRDKQMLTDLELLLLSAARAEAALAAKVGPAARELRAEWSNVLAAFLGK